MNDAVDAEKRSARIAVPGSGGSQWPFYGGLVFWLGFGVAAVALRGVRWDEDYEFAQVILGSVRYPDGHPLWLHARGLYSLQTQLLAGLMRLVQDPGVICGLRNVLFLWASIVPAYLLGARMAGTVMGGHIGVVLTLLGMHIEFFSTYPQVVWPDMYSNGPVGMGMGLLVLYAFASGRLRTGCFLAGLMPCVHLGQWPPVAVVAGFCLWQRPWRDWGALIGWGCAGLAVSGAVWWWVHCGAGHAPDAGGYAASGAPVDRVWLGYMTRAAGHRGFPWGTGHLALGMFLILGLLALRRMPGNWFWRCLVVYGLGVAGLVWGITVVHAVMGPGIPGILVRWMPYRLMNHIPPLLVVGVAGVLWGAGLKGGGARLCVLAVLAFGIVQPGLGLLLPTVVYARYVASGLGALFFLYGAAVVVACREGRLGFWVVIGVAWGVLAWFHQFGAVCALAGGGAVFMGRRIPVWRWMPVAGAGLASGLLVVLMAGQALHREHLPVTAFEGEVGRYLASVGKPGVMIAANHEQETLQARTGHPVLVDMATTTWIGYEPALGPVMDRLYGDVYGIRFDLDAGECDKAWFEVWADRGRDEWVVLGQRYRFGYVIAPGFISLDLPRVVEGREASLYEIPGGPDTP